MILTMTWSMLILLIMAWLMLIMLTLSLQPEMLLHCTKCNSSCHPTCVGLVLDLISFVTSYQWECTDCKQCMTCQDPADEDKMLFCDLCDRGYHSYCVGLEVGLTWHLASPVTWPHMASPVTWPHLSFGLTCPLHIGCESSARARMPKQVPEQNHRKTTKISHLWGTPTGGGGDRRLVDTVNRGGVENGIQIITPPN